jgi:heterodisulfide reductase subunit C
MTVKIKRQTTDGGLMRIVEEMSGVDLSVCYQCMKCAVGCPVAKLTQSPPPEIVRRLHLGAGNALLDSDIIWVCLSCGICYARCPMEINIASVMDALRALALERGASIPKGNMPLFNRMFLRTVKAFGRTYDLSMIAAYKFGAGAFMKDMDKLPIMLKKGKMAFLPPSGADKRIVKRIFLRVQQDKGTGK